MPTIERKKLAITASAQTAYTVPASTAAIIQMCQVANVDGANDVGVDLWWTDAEDADAAVYLAKNVTVAAQDALILCEKLHLKAGDMVKAQASATGDAELTLSILEFAV